MNYTFFHFHHTIMKMKIRWCSKYILESMHAWYAYSPKNLNYNSYEWINCAG